MLGVDDVVSSFVVVVVALKIDWCVIEIYLMMTMMSDDVPSTFNNMIRVNMLLNMVFPVFRALKNTDEGK